MSGPPFEVIAGFVGGYLVLFAILIWAFRRLANREEPPKCERHSWMFHGRFWRCIKCDHVVRAERAGR